MLDSNTYDYRAYSWRDMIYQTYHQVVDTVVEDIQSLVWENTNKARRRVKGDQLEKLTYSVEKLIRDSVSVVIGKERPNCPTAKSQVLNLNSGAKHFSTSKQAPFQVC